MAQASASQKGDGFKNHIENIAIVGVTGNVGKFVVGELLKTGKHKITAISRAESTAEAPAGVVIKKVNYDDQSSLVDALEGQDALVISLGVAAPEDQQTKLIEAAATANVPWILPNEWGFDAEDKKLAKETMFGEKQAKYREHIERLGKSSWIGITCNFWYEFSLSAFPDAFGFDFKNRTVTLIDDGNTRINTSTWPQCGRAVAALLSLKISPDNEHDQSAHLSQFRNKFVYLSSFLISQTDMLHSVMRVTSTTLKDWKVSHEPHQERYDSGVADLQKGNRLGFMRLMYTRVFFPNGGGDYETSKGLDNDILGLPKEDLDEATKVAVQMAEKSAH